MFRPTITKTLVWRRKFLRENVRIMGAAAALSLCAYAEYSRQRNKVEEEEGGENWNSYRGSFPTLSNQDVIAPIITMFGPPNMTSCSEFFNRPRLSNLVRSRTIQRMHDTKAEVTLDSRYDVQWRSSLGEGGFGAVYLAKDRRTKESVAVKKISKKFTDDSSFQREMNAFLHIRERGGHPNICGLRENFDEGDYFYLVLDLVSGGEMFEHLCSHGAYSEADAARLVREVASALAFIHGIGVVHGDLKPENLMLSSEIQSEAVIKLVDFGCAQIIDQNSAFFEKEGSLIAANTPGYSPPEVIDKKQN